jgi:hypothetical protein
MMCHLQVAFELDVRQERASHVEELAVVFQSLHLGDFRYVASADRRPNQAWRMW